MPCYLVAELMLWISFFNCMTFCHYRANLFLYTNCVEILSNHVYVVVERLKIKINSELTVSLLTIFNTPVKGGRHGLPKCDQPHIKALSSIRLKFSKHQET